MTGLDLTGRTAIVAGASRGIGLAAAQAIAAAGANVVLTSRSQESADAAAQVSEAVRPPRSRAASEQHPGSAPADASCDPRTRAPNDPLLQHLCLYRAHQI
jgi:NAD(P)-dependent dehydrogenase (short-subunit alcohol dehydrogenase family)